MQIFVRDNQEILSHPQLLQARNRLFFSLARFAHRIDESTLSLARCGRRQKVKCSIHVELRDKRSIAVTRSHRFTSDALNLALDAVESRVACRVDWHSWINAETLATWIHGWQHPLRRLVNRFRSPQSGNRTVALSSHRKTPQQPGSSSGLAGPKFVLRESGPSGTSLPFPSRRRCHG